MSATHGEGVYGNAAGVTTPLDHKMAQTGHVLKTGANTIRPGLFWDGSTTVVSGKANMSYDVRAFTCVLSRGAAAGSVFLSNDSVYNVVTTAAPGSNSRYDVVYIWQREYTLDGTDSDPVIGVAQGTAAASPTVPSLAAFPGAIELARVLVPAGVTATNSGTTITQTAPFTALADGTPVFRTTTERDTYTPLKVGDRSWVIADSITYRWNGSAWKAWESDWITYTPTLSNLTIGTGGSALSAARYRYVGGHVEVEFKFVLGTSGFAVGSIPTASLPVAAETLTHTLMVADGLGSMYDTSASDLRVAFMQFTSTTVARFAYINPSGIGFAVPTSSAPWTWAAGDALHQIIRYSPA